MKFIPNRKNIKIGVLYGTPILCHVNYIDKMCIDMEEPIGAMWKLVKMT